MIKNCKNCWYYGKPLDCPATYDPDNPEMCNGFTPKEIKKGEKTMEIKLYELEKLHRDSERLAALTDYVKSVTYIEKETLLALLGEKGAEQ